MVLLPGRMENREKYRHSGKYNTSNVIRFLVNLYFVSEKEKYREMALRAGEFCYTAICQSMALSEGRLTMTIQ